MDSVYIVFENETLDYIPKPMNIFEPKIDELSFLPSVGRMPYNLTSTQFPKPRFDPIMPGITIEPKELGKNDKIVCVCKDYETAKQYLNTSYNRYIKGPFKIM